MQVEPYPTEPSLSLGDAITSFSSPYGATSHSRHWHGLNLIRGVPRMPEYSTQKKRPTAWQLKLGQKWITQLDNNSKHTCKSTTARLKKKRARGLQSLYMNHNKMLRWDLVCVNEWPQKSMSRTGQNSSNAR